MVVKNKLSAKRGKSGCLWGEVEAGGVPRIWLPLVERTI